MYVFKRYILHDYGARTPSVRLPDTGYARACSPLTVASPLQAYHLAGSQRKTSEDLHTKHTCTALPLTSATQSLTRSYPTHLATLHSTKFTVNHKRTQLHCFSHPSHSTTVWHPLLVPYPDRLFHAKHLYTSRPFLQSTKNPKRSHGKASPASLARHAPQATRPHTNTITPAGAEDPPPPDRPLLHSIHDRRATGETSHRLREFPTRPLIPSPFPSKPHEGVPFFPLPDRPHRPTVPRHHCRTTRNHSPRCRCSVSCCGRGWKLRV